MRRLLFPISLAVLFTAGIVYSLFFYNFENFITEPRSNSVNPLIGTDFHGHTFPGATMPFGMVQLSPDTRLDGWDGCSAFHYSDTIIYGFSHTHLSGTGCSDYGDILLMPFVKDNPNILEDDFSSAFDKSSVIAKPGYYSVYLKDYNINAELTASSRVGFHKYTFSDTKSQYILLDLEHRDKLLETSIEQISPTTFIGLRRSQAWAVNQFVYFIIEFNQAMTVVDFEMYDQTSSQLYRDNFTGGIIEKNDYSKLILKVKPEDSRELLVKVGLSAVSTDGALKNLESEIPDWDFTHTQDLATKEWDKELSKILVYGGSEEQQTVFYTALYHSFIAPNVFSDVDGSFRGADLNIYKDKNHDTYTVFSLWDTYRATHPLFTLVQQERTLDFIKTFLDQYKYGGRLPVWELWGNETMCMIGYHSVPVIVDAYRKGITNFNTDLALEAMISTAKEDELGKKEFEEFGFIPLDLEHESVSKALEYAYDDWCIAMFAKETGHNDIYKEFIQRSQFYKNILNPDNGFMQARVNGAWQYPFDAREVNFNFTEANSWQYSFYVPHDILSFIELHGGNDKFSRKLDSLFSAESSTTGNNQADITGLIGQYAHGNEPSHHIAYLYNYCGMPWKTQELVREIMAEQYTNKPDGLCGNEDCGQMSSWYVLSAIGLYPVNPASAIYDFGSPLFDTTILQLENHRNFTIIAHNNSDVNIYVQSVRLNGKEYNKTYIKHAQIIKGGKLEFFMGPKANKSWGSSPESIYPSRISENLITPVPFTDYQVQSFRDSISIKLNCPDADADIYYSLGISNSEFVKYIKPIVITDASVLQAYAISEEKMKSKIIFAEYFPILDNRTVSILSTYSPHYSGGGDDALIDYVRGKNSFNNGTWQGYNNQDFEAIIDLTEIKDIEIINASFLQDVKSWIIFPKKVTYFLSNDGINYSETYSSESKISVDDYNLTIQEFKYYPKNTKARYIKVKAESFGKLPEAHISAGKNTWIFIDEIEIK